ncbi:MAG: nucleotide sugar dehydrogenase, partial [Planctomycetaceae bacterium]|nr:nucleotide sugar dehydrogenase [Planctomycetaceae bacterium]
NDPLIGRLPRMRRYPQLAMSSEPLSAELLARQDAVLIVTDHSAYDFAWIVANSPLVVDTRGATRNVKVGREKIVTA